MSILFVAAVDFELDVARRAWSGLSAGFLCAGVGAGATERVLAAALSEGVRFDRVVDIGIAGSCRPGLPIGSVVHVTAEQHGDRAGSLLHNPIPWPALSFLPAATGNTIQQLEDRFRLVDADVETMEGAAFFETCLRHGVPFAEIRAVSNFTGERDHARWDIPLALRQLETALQTLKTRTK